MVDRSTARHRTTGVQRRWWRRLALLVLLGFALGGAAGAVRTLLGPPGVGHFRSERGRAEYAAAYDEAMSALPPPTAVHDVATRWGTVRVYEWAPPGSAGRTPVVLLPGRSSGVPMWQVNLPGFAAQRRILALDALGDAGMSVQGVPLASFDDMAAWIHEVLTQLAPDGAHVVGHSFGGATAAAYARQYPDDVVSLTLLEPVFTFARPPADMMGWAVLGSLPGLPDPVRELALGRIGGGTYDPDDPLARMIAAGSKHYTAALPTPNPLTEDQAARLTMPVYVAIASTDSLAGGRRAADRATAVLPHGIVETWPDTTHSLPMQVAGPLEERLERLWAEQEG